MSNAVVVSVSGGVAVITLNQPEQKNSLSPTIINGVCDSLTDAFKRDDVRVVVLTNAGNTFCAGANLKGGAGEPPARYSLVDIFQLIREGPKPVVGRINGHCMGGGVGLAAACDISIVTSQARLGFTEVLQRKNQTQKQHPNYRIVPCSFCRVGNVEMLEKERVGVEGKSLAEWCLGHACVVLSFCPSSRQ